MLRHTTGRALKTNIEEIRPTQGGWKCGSNAAWENERGLFPAQVFAFIQDALRKLWAEMKTLRATRLEVLLLNLMAKKLDVKASPRMLLHGLKLCHTVIDWLFAFKGSSPCWN